MQTCVAFQEYRSTWKWFSRFDFDGPKLNLQFLDDRVEGVFPIKLPQVNILLLSVASFSLSVSTLMSQFHHTCFIDSDADQSESSFMITNKRRTWTLESIKGYGLYILFLKLTIYLEASYRSTVWYQQAKHNHWLRYCAGIKLISIPHLFLTLPCIFVLQM